MTYLEKRAQSFEHLNPGLLTGIETLPPAGTPLLVISNHCFTLKILPSLLALQKYRGDTTIVCSGGFSAGLNLAGIDTISLPVKNPVEYSDRNANILKMAWGQAIYQSAMITGENAKSLTGLAVVGAMSEKLKSGRALWIAPRGNRDSINNRGKWRPGLGRLLIELLNKGGQTQIAMINVNEFCLGSVVNITSVENLAQRISLNAKTPSRKASNLVKQYYWNQVKKLR